MRDKQPLLSICIPTYNRCILLDQVLQLYTQNKYFDERVEIVISDNCSTDATESICLRYVEQFNNIRYYKNSSNIVDKNFSKVLSYGKGKYLRLVNDYCYLDDNSLLESYRYIEKYAYSGRLLFFYNSLWGIKDSNIEVDSLNAFVEIASNRITWISHFGCWRDIFIRLDNKDKYCEQHFCQIDWTLRIVNDFPSVIIVNKPLLKELPIEHSKSGYNFFRVHLDNYYFMYDQYLRNNTISPKTIKRDKRKILYYWIGDSIVNLLFIKDKKKYSFDITDGFKITYKHYKYSLLYYCFLFKGVCCKLLIYFSIFEMVNKLRKRFF